MRSPLSALSLASLALALYSLGSAVQSIADEPPPPETPAAIPAETPAENPTDVLRPATAENQSPTASEETSHKRSPIKPAWPGSYIGLRAAGAIGASWLPSGSSVGPGLAANANSAASLDIAPVLGVELGYSNKHWGVAFTLEGSPLGLLSPSFLAGAPTRWEIGFQVNYIPNRKVRLVMGIDPFVACGTTNLSGQDVLLHGIGARVGIHVRMTEPGTNVWEAFGYGTLTRFSSANVTTSGFSQTLTRDDVGGVNQFLGYAALVGGFQFNFSY